MPNHMIFNERPECQDRVIAFLQKMGYEYVSRSEAEQKRGSLSKVIFTDELIRFLNKQTYKYKNYELNFSGESIQRAITALDASLLQGLAMASKEIYNLLTLGISVEENIVIDQDIPVRQSFDLSYIDFEHPANNIWQVTEEFSVERPNGQYARPDVVIMVNGIPLAVIECKKSSIDVKEGVLQNVRNMSPDYIPHLFKYSQLVISMNPNKVVYGTCGTSADYFVEWREEDIEWQEAICKRCSKDGNIIEQDRAVTSLLEKNRFLTLIHDYILYDSNIKKICRHQQYFAVEKAIKRINGEDDKNTTGGVIWHTQGSGKSLTMVMLVKKIQSLKAKENPRFVIVTDRVSLDKQIRDNFANSQMDPVRAATGKGLKTILKDKSNLIVTTLINKFETVCKNHYLEKDSDKFYVLIDEAHRSQYSTMYNYMREVLPNATLIAFTGTPLISKSKRNTYKKFGDPIHNYTMKRSIEDKITVPLVYEGRKVKQNDPSNTIDAYFESLTENLPDDIKRELKSKFSKWSKLAEASSRINLIAFDIYDHFVNYCLPKGLKAMVVCSSRATAVDVFNIISSLPGKEVNPRVVITFGDKREGEDDDVTTTSINKINSYYNKYVKPLFGENDEKYTDSVCDDFKNPDGDINMLIVKDMLLTGFDAPIAGVLYVDKTLQKHSLLQAIARVNRVYKGKDFGLIVDYWGIFKKLRTAIDLYDDAESSMNSFDQEDIEDAILGPIDEMNKLEKAHKELLDMFPGFDDNTSSDKWQLSLEDEVKRNDFYAKLKEYANLLNLALTNREIFVTIGFDKLEEYRKDYRFFDKLRQSVIERFDNEIDLSKYEVGIKNLLDTFVNATDVHQIIKPVSITDEAAMKKLLCSDEPNNIKADKIKTRIESELKQVRYDDPLLFEEFSTKIKKTLAEYNHDRDADKYFNAMEAMADDFRNGRLSRDYPVSIANDSDAKAFYGAVINILRDKTILNLTDSIEDTISEYSRSITKAVSECAKRDWKHNEVVHKQIHRSLDDCLFEMFDEIGYEINKSNIDVLDLMIDEIMKVAVARY
ncbi:type I restriction endonuclease subunit R [uncultured Ruminococcus sp.]|uniref:type I restriction endonuclease subunit R n=1 Tax=uncultured Ruminococcus sp. TaxID=165186 RepID=UPI0025F87D13|nr:type I restriction endonuclease subunit R [uncultured Ruminococcus sp.]